MLLSNFSRNGFRADLLRSENGIVFQGHLEEINLESLNMRRLSFPEVATLRLALTLRVDCAQASDGLIAFPRIG